MTSLRTLSLAGAFALASATAAYACGGEMESWLDADPRLDYATEITGVEAGLLDSDPALLRVTVTAEVPTAGWSEAALVPVTYITQPHDGIYDVFLLALPPDGMVAQVISSLTATLELPVGEGIAGYRILGYDNCVTLVLDDQGLPPGDGCELQTVATS